SFLLTRLLAERLRAYGGRVVTTASAAHLRGELDLADLQMERTWTWERAYGRSKLANILMTVELRRREGLRAFAFHPGLIETDSDRDLRSAGMAEEFDALRRGTAAEGAETLVWLATCADDELPAAIYLVGRKPGVTSPAARDPELAARLWDATAALAG